MSDYVYCHIWDGHFKVWGYDSYKSDGGPFEFICYWGRIGVPMQRLQKRRREFSKFGEARAFLMAKLQDKELKGYVPIKNSVYFSAVDNNDFTKIIGAVKRAAKRLTA